MQLELCTKSYLQTRINSSSLESHRLGSSVGLLMHRLKEKVRLLQVWKSHAVVSCCFVCLFSNTLYIYQLSLVIDAVTDCMI